MPKKKAPVEKPKAKTWVPTVISRQSLFLLEGALNWQPEGRVPHGKLVALVAERIVSDAGMGVENTTTYFIPLAEKPQWVQRCTAIRKRPVATRRFSWGPRAISRRWDLCDEAPDPPSDLASGEKVREPVELLREVWWVIRNGQVSRCRSRPEVEFFARTRHFRTKENVILRQDALRVPAVKPKPVIDRLKEIGAALE
ncbi:MAG: hypothetical protein JWM59_3282 [Verrucomicrobiales bacterium]|nr:hypothetical protein [Verrucomicrobiales bacterium]